MEWIGVEALGESESLLDSGFLAGGALTGGLTGGFRGAVSSSLSESSASGTYL